MSEERKRLSPEEILDEIHALAKTGDDSNKRWALKMLAPQESNTTFLVEPLGVHEVVDRAVVMMRAWGQRITQMAWNKAFAGSQNRKPTDELEISGDDDMITPEAMAVIRKLVSVKQLYKFAPEVKKPGTMRGEPRGRGAEAMKRFVQHEAKKIAIDRARTHRNQITGRPLGEDDGIPTAVETEGVPDLG